MTTPLLKIMSLIAAFATIQGAATVRAAVNMISIEHRVWGDAGESPANYTYDETSTAPLSRDSSSSGYADYYASSTASDWSVNAYRNGSSNHANGYARNTYVFNPLSEQLTISLGGVIGTWWFENNATMTLTDLSTNSLVSSYYSASYSGISPFPTYDDSGNDVFSWQTTVEVEPAHQYALIIQVSAHRGEGGDGSASLDLALAPEPGTTLLASMAVLFMCVRRKRDLSPEAP